jgi:hypothetical protein
MSSFLSSTMWLTVSVTAVALALAIGTKLLFRRGKSLEQL